MYRKIFIICFFFIITNAYSQSDFYKAVYNGDIDYIYKYFVDRDSPNEHFKFSNNDLRILRNTIYAKHGYIFKLKDLQEHFKKFKWYKGTKENVDGELTENEKRVIRIISATEKANPPSINDLIGRWDTPAPPGSNADRLGFISIYLNKDGTLDMGRWGSGVWSLNGTTFRYRLDPAKGFNETENFRINFVEYKDVLYGTCTFFMNDTTIFEGWGFYGPNKRPSTEMWGYPD